ncbi:flagellin [Salipiger mangrovisoli]|uniref:Flagellin n=1 Tax=Salipiger mangrovisoli TaxID=2865933 RepID=A0ABR9X8M5_9RHOB|nr:flagellin [Salipiger mangrovisoli]MBE9639954.1 flagellar protein [Salipiger mangrovisoli]
MTSVRTNISSMSALLTLTQIGKDLETTQTRISTGLKVASGKDNAAYYAISESMGSDASVYGAISEGLTLTRNSLSTARLGAESFQDIAGEFVDRLAFAQGAEGGMGSIETDLKGLVSQMKDIIAQATFNGNDLVNAAGASSGTAAVTALGVLTTSATVSAVQTVVTGITRGGGSLSTTSTTFQSEDLTRLMLGFDAIATGFEAHATAATGPTFLQNVLSAADGLLSGSIAAATRLGVAEKGIEKQQDFLSALVDNLKTGIGGMIDANMEEEAARLQALQIQQQLATQALSIANAQPQGILALFQ